MRANRICSTLTLILAPAMLASAQQAPEAGSPRGRFPGVQVESVKQKLSLVDALLTKSPAMARIASGRNQQAQDKAQQARELYQRAQAAMAKGDNAVADGHLNDALRLMSTASQSVPDPKHTLTEQRAEYADLVQKIEAFQISLQHFRQQFKHKTQADVAPDIERIRTMVKAATALENAGDLPGASKILVEAHTISVATLNKMVSGETLVYDLRFSSAADEFRYELERHRSYEELIPIAVNTLHPTGEANRLIDRYFEQSERLKVQAEEEAARGEHKNALIAMREAIDYLQKALQSVGIVVPQTIEK